MDGALSKPDSQSGSSDSRLTTADGRPLKAALAQAEAKARRKAFFLVMPLFLFVLITFVSPIGQLLHRSVNNPGFTTHENLGTGVKTPIMVNLRQWFDENPSGTDPDESAYTALAADLVTLRELKAPGQVGTRINYERSGSRSLFTKTARKAQKLEAPFKEAILDVDEDWADPKLWSVMRGASSAYTFNFYLAALDMARDETGQVTAVDQKRQVYVKLFTRTLMLSLLITFMCFLLAYPVAHLLATLPLRYSN
ncbi:MAG: ABC transporter permease, partial [Litoreibacter sp.]|nr:ABC transporter permease [Litoreibacter sp.]